jgi:hypothetical protein
MMAVPSVVLLIPKFLVLKQIGLYDSYAGLVVPLLVDATGVFLMMQAFESVPVQVGEAARCDGCNISRTSWSELGHELHQQLTDRADRHSLHRRTFPDHARTRSWQRSTYRDRSLTSAASQIRDSPGHTVQSIAPPT